MLTLLLVLLFCTQSVAMAAQRVAAITGANKVRVNFFSSDHASTACIHEVWPLYFKMKNASSSLYQQYLL
jgi:hypothetical protein